MTKSQLAMNSTKNEKEKRFPYHLILIYLLSFVKQLPHRPSIIVVLSKFLIFMFMSSVIKPMNFRFHLIKKLGIHRRIEK